MSIRFESLRSRHPGYVGALLLAVVGLMAGYGAAHYMDSHGHWVTGMSNQVVWGLPHVFAIFLILAASGALNVASMGSVLNIQRYKPWARLSAVFSICLLVGGLLILVLDLGRPERLIVAMTHYNFRSIFAWNIFLYSGLLLIAIAYLTNLFIPGQEVVAQKVGVLAFIWRFVLTAGTGSIFGFLVARQFYDSAMMVPLFIVASLVVGTALFILLVIMLRKWQSETPELELLQSLTRLLGLLLALLLFLVAAFHLTNLYIAQHIAIERFVLWQGGIYPILFWGGQVLIGGVIPLGMIYLTSVSASASKIGWIASCAVGGVVSLLYVTIIGGQVFPQTLFPGKTVSSSFFDGVVARYVPALPEWLLGLGGVSLVLMGLLLALRILPFIPRQISTTDSLR